MQNDKYFVLILFFDLNHCFKTTSVYLFNVRRGCQWTANSKTIDSCLVTVAFAFLPGFPIDFKAEGKMTFSLISFVSDIVFPLVLLASKLKQKIFIWLD